MDVLMPQLGETVTEGKIATWFKKPGERVEKGDNLFEIETDKVTMEVQAIDAGILSEVRVAAGETVPVGTVVAVIGGAQAASPAPASAPAQVATPAPARSAEPVARANGHAAPAVQPTGPARSLESWGFGPFNEVNTPTKNYGKAKVAGLRASPLARRLAAQSGLDLTAIAARVSAAGRDKILKDDVLAELAARPAQAAAPAPAPLQPAPAVARPAPQPAAPAAQAMVASGAVQAVPLNRIRQATGRHLAESWRTAPHVLQTVEADFDAIAKVRAAKKETFQQQHGIALTYLPFIARAVCIAIAAYPQINARFDGDQLLVSRDVHLGFAVDLNHDGLVVPVVRHADLMNVTGLAKAIDRQVEKARAGRLTQDDIEGGTYSISNNGSFGTLFTMPLINGPQVAILSTDGIRKRPVVMETAVGDVIVARPMGILAQSFDHRAFDGAYSGAFLQKLKQIIETRDWAAELA